MKQSTGRLQGARLLSRETLLGVAAVAVAGLAACGGHSSNSCHNLSQAYGLFGQTNFNLGTPNTKGVSGGTLSGPVGAVAMGGNTVYVADANNNRILGFSNVPAAGGNVSITAPYFAGAASFVIGQPDATTTNAGIGAGTGTPIQFNFPTKVSVGTSGGKTYLVVADSGNNRVLIWNKLPTSNVAPDVVIGQTDINGGGLASTPSASTLSNPTGAYISDGYLVVADKGNNRVLIWNGVPTASGTAASIELGQSATDASGNVTCTSNTGSCFSTAVAGIDQFPNGAKSYILAMNQPSDVWTNGTRLLVADTGNHRVLLWNGIPTSNNLLASNLIGASQFGATSLNGGSGTQGLHSPGGVSANDGGVYVADTVNNRVLVFQSYLSAPSNGPAATYVYGQSDFIHLTANDPDQNGQIGDQRNNPATNGITQDTLSSPQGVLATSSNQLFVTDTANSRVMLYTQTDPTTGVPTGVDGTNPQDSNHCY